MNSVFSIFNRLLAIYLIIKFVHTATLEDCTFYENTNHIEFICDTDIRLMLMGKNAMNKQHQENCYGRTKKNKINIIITFCLNSFHFYLNMCLLYFVIL